MADRSPCCVEAPEKLTVSEWADKYRVLDSKTSAEPGLWSTDRTPYLRGIMDSFTDPIVEEVVFLKPTQVGGTECLNNMLGYVISQDPNPVMVVYPNEKLAQFTSENRLQPMVKLSPALESRFHENQSKDLELQFDGMYVVIAGAASPAGLSSLPARYLFMDEVDKYPAAAGKEADPRSLARERTNTFPTNKKSCRHRHQRFGLARSGPRGNQRMFKWNITCHVRIVVSIKR